MTLLFLYVPLTAGSTCPSTRKDANALNLETHRPPRGQEPAEATQASGEVEADASGW